MTNERAPIERALERLVRDARAKLGVDAREVLEETIRQASAALIRGLGAEYGLGATEASRCAALVLRELGARLASEAPPPSLASEQLDAISAAIAAAVVGRAGEA